MPMPDPQTTFSGPTQAGSGQPSRLTSMGQADDLAAWLLSPHRDRIVVVGSVPPGEPDPGFDVARVARDHADRVEVYVLPFGELTGRLTSHLPQDCGLAGSGVRLYPVLRKWQHAPVAAPLVRRRPASATDEVGAQLDRALQSVLTQDAVPGPRPLDAAPAEFTADGLKRVLTTEAQAVALARFLVNPQRTLPVLAVTVHPDMSEPYVQSATLAQELEGLAAVVELTADATYGLTDGLGDKRYSVFYGACRVYPVGAEWLQDMYRAPLHMTTSWTAARRLTPALLDDALVAAHQAGLLQPSAVRKDDRRVEAKVIGPTSELHVLLRLPDGAQALMRAAELRLGVPIDRLVGKGQRLAGRARRAGALWQFLPDPVDERPELRAQELLPDGSLALASVAHVEADTAVLHLHPDVAGALEQGDPDEDLRDLLDVGDVVVVRVSWEDGEPVLELAEPGHGAGTADVHALPVLPGGPPWLRPDDLLARRAEETLAEEAAQEDAVPVPAPPAEPAPAEPAPAPAAPARAGRTAPASAPAAPAARSAVPEAEVTRYRRQLEDAKATIAQYEDRHRRLERHLERVKEQARSARAAARRGKGAGQAAPRPVFADPHRQLRHEIWLAYLDRFPEQERALRELPEDYSFGPEFVATLEQLRVVSREKVVEVLVEVLLALDAELDGRELHPWREGRGGAQQQRPDGAVAWRVALQRGTPGARRMKYWRHPGGRVEFDSVGHHDDGL
jgi:hypothetical protein